MADEAPGAPPQRRLIHVELPGLSAAPTPYARADRDQAVADLLAGNSFSPEGVAGGPFILHLAVHEGRLLFGIHDAQDKLVHTYALALGPFRRLIKDYHMVVESHERAVTEGSAEARIQAIDMGRRGLHNEGARLLEHRLAGRIGVDFETARRLFTLVCALHRRA